MCVFVCVCVKAKKIHRYVVRIFVHLYLYIIWLPCDDLFIDWILNKQNNNYAMIDAKVSA